MHGFIGSVRRSGPSDEAPFAWMRDWLAAGVPRQAWEAGDDDFRFLASLEPDETQAAARDEDGRVLVYDGFVAADQFAPYGQTERRDEIARAMLTLWQDDGPDALAGLNGRYVAAAWDPRERVLYLANDVLGFKPVFMWRHSGSVLFSSNLWAIACHPDFRGVVDPEGLADLLMVSHQQGTRTLFRDVSVLPPGSVSVFRDGESVSRNVRSMEFTTERWTHGMHRIADEMHQTLAMSLNRRVAGDTQVLLPLSGGFDSRTMLGLLQENGARPRALTQCQPGAFGIDTRFARQLARRVGVPHRVVPLRDDFLARYRRKCVGINGGLYDIHTGRYLSMVEQQEGGGLPTVSGHLGGELTGRFQVADTRFSTPEERYELAWREVNMFRFTPEQAAGLLGNGRGADLASSVVQRSRRFFFAGDGEPYQRFLRWDVLLYRRRFISFQLLYLEQFCRTVAPFTDRDLVDFICSLPFAALEDQRAYREMICRHFRELARVPNTNDLPLLTTTRGVLKDFLYSQYKRFFRKPLQRLLHLRRWVDHPNVQLGYALAGESSAVLDHIEASRERMAPYLDPDGVAELVRRHRAGDYDSTNGLLALSTFATALEMLEEPRSALNVWEESQDA